MEWQIIIDGKIYDGIIGDRNYDSNNIIADNEPVADSLNKIANYLNTEDFVEKRYYPAWQDFTVVGTEYYLTLDQNATSNFTIDNLNRVATDILDFSVINPTNRNLMYKSGSLLNINSNVVRVLSFDYMTGKVTLNFTPKNTFRINYLCQYANNEVPIGKKLEVENTEITVQNSDDASEIAYNNSTSALTSTDVQSAIDELVRTANYDSIGIIKAPTATANPNGTVTVASDGSYLLSKANTLESMIVKTENVTGATLTPTDNTINFLYVDYNSGTPTYGITTSLDFITTNFTRCPVIRVVREGTTLHFEEYDESGAFTATKLLIKNIRVNGFERTDGLILSTSATRIATLTSGEVWFGVQKYNMPTISTGGVGVNTFEYYLVAGVWNKSANLTLFDSTYYSNGTNRQNLTVNRFVAKYFFRDVGVDNELYYIHGNQYTSLTLAQNEILPPVPAVLSAHAIYVGKIVVQQNATLGTASPRTWGESIQNSIATSHEDLSNIQQVGTGITNGHISDSTQTIGGAKTFSTSISTPIIKAISDSTSAVSITKADGISKVVEVDTTNSKLIVNGDILVQSLSGISDRNLGVDALGNLKVISSSGVATASAILDFGNEENYVTVDIADVSIIGSEKIFVSYEGAEEVALQGLNCGLLSKSVGVGYTIFGGAPNGASGQFTVNIIKL